MGPKKRRRDLILRDFREWILRERLETYVPQVIAILDAVVVGENVFQSCGFNTMSKVLPECTAQLRAESGLDKFSSPASRTFQKILSFKSKHKLMTSYCP
jgi:hypothetical protein